MKTYRIKRGTFCHKGKTYTPAGINEIETHLKLTELFPDQWVEADKPVQEEIEQPRANHPHGVDVTNLFEGADPAGLTVRQKNSWFRLYINGNLHSAKGLRKKEMEQLVSECVAAFHDGGDA